MLKNLQTPLRNLHIRDVVYYVYFILESIYMCIKNRVK